MPTPLAGVERSHANQAGELNQSRILVHGTRIEHWLNGVKVVSADAASAAFRVAAEPAPARTKQALQYLSIDKEFPLSFRCHTGTIWLRSIKIQPLSPPER